MKYALFLILLFSQISLRAQDSFAISGKIVLPDVANEEPSGGSFIITLADSSGKLIGGALDSMYDFAIFPVKNGRYKLQIKSTQDYLFATPAFDTTVIIYNRSVKIIANISPLCLYYSTEVAREDIDSNRVRLILPQSPMFKPARQERRFEKKYNVTYEWTGCRRFDFNSCVAAYNQTVFAYLDKRYGRKWRKVVISDVVGLK